MRQDEQMLLLEEALHWASIALRSAQSQYSSVSGSEGGRPAADAKDIEAARQRLDMAQQTVDEIRGRMARRDEQLRQAAQR